METTENGAQSNALLRVDAVNQSMGLPSRNTARSRTPSYLLPSVVSLSFFSLAALLLYKVDDFVTQTKTVAGHNLEPTPWHPFPPEALREESRHPHAYKIIQCSYLTCRYSNETVTQLRRPQSSLKCPDFFRWIHRDLEPWSRSRITTSLLMEAKKFASLRIVIYGGKLYTDMYYACVQSRAMFTIWGLLQLLRRYPGMVPDVDFMFDCMDKPTVNRTEHESMPIPLFRYCTTGGHFDIPFPDWSFWGWPETHLRPWDEEFQDIKKGSQTLTWEKKFPRAYWKGNPNVESPLRLELLKCNHSRLWGAQILSQDWGKEASAGYEKSKLSNQCNHRYKIYAEGYAWSVSLKYILSCGSLALIISPQYEDFFSRGLIPKKNYWPVSYNTNLCRSIKFAVDWGNSNPAEAEAIGKRGQDLMASLSMDRVYDYMYHLIREYAKLQDFKPFPPSSALEVCSDSLLCLANPIEKQLLERSITSISPDSPCTLQPPNSNIIDSWIRQKKEIIEDLKDWERQTA